MIVRVNAPTYVTECLTRIRRFRDKLAAGTSDVSAEYDITRAGWVDPKGDIIKTLTPAESICRG
jgi:hypothetical protein